MQQDPIAMPVMPAHMIQGFYNTRVACIKEPQPCDHQQCSRCTIRSPPGHHRPWRFSQQGLHRFSGLSARHRPTGMLIVDFSQLYGTAQQRSSPPKGSPTARTIRAEEEVPTR